jgi:mono/diheme cytochrome c family protein
VPITGEVLTAAAPLYEQNCARCHGEKGAAVAPEANLLPKQPANLTDAKLIKSSRDGELFWKITNGRDPMPSFRQLSNTQRWQLVDYVRYLADRSQYRYLAAHSQR